MEVNISNISNKNIILDNDFNIEKDYYKDSLKDLKNLHIKGNIKLISDELTIDALITGTMVLLDSISLEEVEYNFEANINDQLVETFEKSPNILDITSFLWQNIYLEIPLKLTNVNDFSEYHGDGWKLESEDSIKENTNNPFKDLKELIGKE